MKTKNHSIPLIILLFILVSFHLNAQEPEIKAELSQDSIAAGNEGIISITYIIPEGYYQGLQEKFFNFRIKETAGLSLGSLLYPPGQIKGDETIYTGEVTISAPLLIDSTVPVGSYKITVFADYQLCTDDGTCLFPESIEVEILLDVEESADTSQKTGILWFLLLALLGGILLNVMPCVLPVLSLKALSLVHQSKNNKKEILTGSWLYAAGIIFSLFIFATVITIIKLSGERVGWGFQFQNTGFVLGLITIIYLFALSLFEVFIITPPGLNKAAGLSGRKGNIGSFLSGVFAVLLATPCTAPFLGTALGFAFSQPPLIIYLIFLFVGLGLALPFLLLGFFPGFVKALPKPGAWMNTFREIMGFLLIATVIWLFTVLYKQVGGAGILDTLIYIFSLTISAWILGKWTNHARKKRTRIIAAFVALLLAGGTGWMLFSQPKANEIQKGEYSPVPSGWEKFDPELLLDNVNQGEPVFLAFSAQWCLTCKTNEKTTLLTPWGNTFFSEQGIKRYYGDYTRNDPVIAEWIENFGRAGVPVYVYFPSEGEAVVLPEIINRKILEDVINPR